MKLFGMSSSNLMEVEIEKATSDKNTTEKWGMILDICDKIGTTSGNAKESLKIILKRLNHPDPHVVVQAITLLDACVNNCGKNYHLEIASRDFETEYKRLILKSEPPVANKLKAYLKKWAEGDFKKDPQLNLIPSMYSKLKQEGHDFSDTEVAPKREVQLSKDPNVVSSQQEEDDIAKAIELSLKEKTTSPKAQSSSYSSSLYPTMTTSSTTGPISSSSASAPAPEPRKVRALYDFEAAEDNELTFKAGEVIMVIEESDANWWRGSNHRGEGFFPANFVTTDLNAEPEDLAKDTKSNKKIVQFNGEAQSLVQQPVEVNEDSIDRLLFLLHEADPSDPSQDSEEMMRLENVVNQMGPLIDSELERVDRKHAQLTQLSSDLIDTINLYHSLMRETERTPAMGGYNAFNPGHHQQIYSTNSGMGFPMNNNVSYRMPQSNMVAPPGMMMQQGVHGEGMHGQGMQYPPNSSAPQANFQMPQQQSGPGSFQPQVQNQMMPTSQQNQSIMPPNGLPQHPQHQMHVPGMLQHGGPPQMISGQVHQQQIQAQGQNFPSQHIHQPQPISQQNGFPTQNFQMNPNQQMLHQNMPQMNQMLGNLSLQSPPVSMQNHHQPQQGPVAMQVTQPMTFNLQTDSNQNIPVYQQQR